MSVRRREWTNSKGETKTSWIVDYVDQTGRRHIKTFARKKDADAYHAQARVEVRAGVHTADSDSKTVQAAADLWLATCEAAGLEAATLAAYRQHVRLHILPYLGRGRLSQLSTPMIRSFEDDLRVGAPAPGEETGKPRSAAMVKRVLRSLGAIVADAQERGLVARNVVRELRSNRHRGKERRAERRQKGKLRVGVDIPTREEIKAIVASFKGRKKPLILTAIFTGLRGSELRGLRWCDVDFARRELHVRQRADRYRTIGKPKSESGNRTLPFPSLVLNALREWKLQCPPSAQDLVFPSSNGNVDYHSNIIKTALWPAQVEAGVTIRALDEKGEPLIGKDGKPIIAAKYSGMHALRHFYASWCINAKEDGGLGLSPKVVQERLGHSTIMMTLDVYGHLFPRDDEATQMDAAERSLLG
ncbi:site-specific integrase [Rhodoblastus sp.]|uniref:tyrosine-type recombinase/integrase n=1 Tax=Rhodoblastus sp. TaxID=1962975 RepID=UPI00260F65F4|nr:site-specific integrase [Rhodoblastus sp.]